MLGDRHLLSGQSGCEWEQQCWWQQGEYVAGLAEAQSTPAWNPLRSSTMKGQVTSVGGAGSSAVVAAQRHSCFTTTGS